MSRASTTEPLHLVVRPNTASLIVSSDDYPKCRIPLLPEDLRTFRVIWHWLQMSDQGRNPLFRGNRTPSESAQEIPYSILIALLNFINPEVASFLMRQLAKDVSASKNIPGTEIAQIPQFLSVQLSRGNGALSLITASSFFDYRADSLTCLLNASLNADLKTVKRIFEKTHPDSLRRLLSAEQGTGFAATRLGRVTVERTGTPLQMAIYDNDEGMVAFFKEKMDSVEFQHQCFAVIGENYDAFLRKQEAEATALCAGLEDEFNAARSNEFTVDNNYAASTTSTQLQSTVDAFINKLMDYVRNNPVHNPAILQRVYEIYSRLPSDFNRDCYFSQKVISGAQSFLSARWLQHYAQGIDYLAGHHEAPRRSFICRDSSPQLDIRNVVGSCIGSDSFLLSISGAAFAGRGGRVVLSGRGRGVRYYKNYVAQKQQAFRTLCREGNRLTAA